MRYCRIADVWEPTQTWNMWVRRTMQVKNMIMETVTSLHDVGTWGRLGTVRRPEMEDGRSFECHGLRGYEEPEELSTSFFEPLWTTSHPARTSPVRLLSRTWWRINSMPSSCWKPCCTHCMALLFSKRLQQESRRSLHIGVEGRTGQETPVQRPVRELLCLSRNHGWVRVVRLKDYKQERVYPSYTINSLPWSNPSLSELPSAASNHEGRLWSEEDTGHMVCENWEVSVRFQ